MERSEKPIEGPDPGAQEPINNGANYLGGKEQDPDSVDRGHFGETKTRSLSSSTDKTVRWYI